MAVDTMDIYSFTQSDSLWLQGNLGLATQLKKLFIVFATAVGLIGCQPAIAAVDDYTDPRFYSTISVSALTLLNDFKSRNESRRKRSWNYLLGVLDATEGQIWCGYSTLDTNTVITTAIEALEMRSNQELQRRAAHVLEAQLEKSFPCKPRSRQ